MEKIFFRPICLPKRKFVDFPDGSLAISVGWGRGTSDLKFTKTANCDETLANRVNLTIIFLVIFKLAN